MPRGIEQIVNERVLRWHAERRSTTPPPSSAVRQGVVAQRPMITISRECGSLGGDVGRLVAQKLGFSFYSQELVHEIASAAHVRSDTVQSLDEQPRGGFEVMVREILEGEAFAAKDYLHYLRAVLRVLGSKGHGVVMGRGGHLIMDPVLTLRVRCYAGVAQRTANLARRFDMTLEQASILARRVDRERALFYQQRFATEWDDAELFDVMINTTSVPVDQCADMVAAAYRARFGARATD